MKLCSSCKTKNLDDSIYCRKCGEKIKEYSIKLSRKYIFICSLLFFGLYFFIFAPIYNIFEYETGLDLDGYTAMTMLNLINFFCSLILTIFISQDITYEIGLGAFIFVIIIGILFGDQEFTIYLFERFIGFSILGVIAGKFTKKLLTKLELI